MINLPNPDELNRVIQWTLSACNANIELDPSGRCHIDMYLRHEAKHLPDTIRQMGLDWKTLMKITLLTRIGYELLGEEDLEVASVLWAHIIEQIGIMETRCITRRPLKEDVIVEGYGNNIGMN